MKILGLSRLQFPVSDEVKLVDVIATSSTRIETGPSASATRHSVLLQAGVLQLTPPTSSARGGMTRPAQLLILNPGYEQNKAIIHRKACELVLAAKHQYQRVLVNGAEAGLVAGCLGGIGQGISKGSVFGPKGAIIGGTVGFVGGTIVSGYRTVKIIKQRQALREVGEVIALYEDILAGRASGHYIVQLLLHFEKTRLKLSQAAENTFKELERILECMRQEPVINLMKQYAIQKNSQELQMIRGANQ